MASVKRAAPRLLTLFVAFVMAGLGRKLAGGPSTGGNLVLAGLVVGGASGFIATIATLAGAKQIFRRALVAPLIFLAGSALLGEGAAAVSFGRATLTGLLLGGIGAALLCMTPQPPEDGDDEGDNGEGDE